MPIDQAAAVKAVLLDSKISNGLYNSLGVDVNHLKKSITQEISRGIASNLSYSDIARNLSNASKGKYIAESFVAYTKGETNILDPVFVDFLNNKLTGDIYSGSAIIDGATEAVRNGINVLKTIWLPKSEYANVMSELATNTTAEQRNQFIISKPIGDYIYTVENQGFGSYRVIGKLPIDGYYKE